MLRPLVRTTSRIPQIIRLWRNLKIARGRTEAVASQIARKGRKTHSRRCTKRNKKLELTDRLSLSAMETKRAAPRLLATAELEKRRMMSLVVRSAREAKAELEAIVDHGTSRLLL